MADEAKTDGPAEHELVRAVRLELVRADVLMTWRGQVALQLARRLVDPEASAPASLADKLAAAMTAAVGAPSPAPPAPGPSAGKPDDELPDAVAAARARRDATRAAAGSA